MSDEYRWIYKQISYINVNAQMDKERENEREREREREKEREFDRQINTYVDWSGVELEGDPDFEGLADGQAVEVVHALEQEKNTSKSTMFTYKNTCINTSVYLQINFTKLPFLSHTYVYMYITIEKLLPSMLLFISK